MMKYEEILHDTLKAYKSSSVSHPKYHSLKERPRKVFSHREKYTQNALTHTSRDIYAHIFHRSFESLKFCVETEACQAKC